MVKSEIRPKRHRFAMGLAIAIGLTLGAAAPAAVAAGSFTVKSTPYGCTETDFSGKSWALSNGGAARTWHGNIVCWSGTTQVGARATVGSKTSAWKYVNGSPAQISITGSGTTYGAHSLCSYYFGALYCTGIRYT